MEYAITRGQYGLAFFLDTGEKFYKKQPYPADHVFDCPILIGLANPDDPTLMCKDIAKHTKDWTSSLTPELQNEFFTMLVRMNRTIRYGEPSLVDGEDEENSVNWGIRKDGHTRVSRDLQDLVDELNCIFGGPVGLLHNIQKHILKNIANDVMSCSMVERDVVDRSIPFKDEHLVQLATVILFLKIMTPVTCHYHFNLVSNYGTIPRPWMVLFKLYEEAFSQYCPKMLKQLTKVVAAHIEVTQPKRLLVSETQLQLKEWLFVASAKLNMYTPHLNMVESVYGVFRGNR